MSGLTVTFRAVQETMLANETKKLSGQQDVALRTMQVKVHFCTMRG